MPRYGSAARGIGMVLAFAAAAVVPLMSTPAAAASLGDPPWTHAAAWGSNIVGEVGNGSTGDGVVDPVPVDGTMLGFPHVSAAVLMAWRSPSTARSTPGASTRMARSASIPWADHSARCPYPYPCPG